MVYLEPLFDILAGRSRIGSSSGPSPILTNVEENYLADFVKKMAHIGFPLRQKDLCLDVKRILDVDGRKNPFKDNLPGDISSIFIRVQW